MVATDLCKTEETILLLLDRLVDPLLPAKTSVRNTPSQSKQHLVAKQVHAVVLLYNYYHRKQHQQLKFEGFVSFSKLAVVLKPTLMAHMKLMLRSDDFECDDPEKQLSVTEKAIMEACDISNGLDASKDVPKTEGWSISKVAVLLIDSMKEKCYLKNGSVTQGVWSLFEKDVDVASCISEGVTEGSHKRKKIKVTRNSLGDVVDEASLKQVAFSAVKEAAGIDQSNLIMIGSDVAYSLSKEKSLASFYTMQCKEPPKNDDVVEVPIKYVIDSLQGPLVTRSSREWTVTPVVDHFHLLPYAGFISDWLSRDVLSSSSKDQMSAMGRVNITNSKMKEEACQPETPHDQYGTHVDFDKIKYLGSSASTSAKSLMQTEKNGCAMDGLSGDREVLSSCFNDQMSNLGDINVSNSKITEEPYEPDIHDIQDRSHVKSKICIGSNAYYDIRVQVDDHQKLMTSSLKSDLNGTAGINTTKIERAGLSRMPCITQCRDENAPNFKAISGTTCSDEYKKPNGGCTMVIDKSCSKDTDRVQNSVVSEGKSSQTALKSLLSRRNKLNLLQRQLEDEIALCDKRIQDILTGGNDDSQLNIESHEEGSNDIFPGSFTHDGIYQQFVHQSSSQSIKMKPLSEAVLVNSCQELDCICSENNWILPTYRISLLDGGFQAHLTVKGIDFECSSTGDRCASPREARASAAAQVLAKLRSMASQSQ